MSNRSASGARGTRSSAHLGATLRSILIAPDAGFRAAVRAAERRAKRGERPAEGRAPYVLAAVGGAALVLLYLKISALAGIRDGSAQSYRMSVVAATLVLGAVLGIVSQLLWGGIAAPLFRLIGGETSPPSARLVWGAAFFPQVFTVFLLLPIDLLVSGSSALTDARPEDPVAAAWAALSLSIGVALAIWSLGLLVKGVQISSSGLGLRRALLGSAFATACVLALGAAMGFGLVALSEAAP